jgi:hypothetical protein
MNITPKIALFCLTCYALLFSLPIQGADNVTANRCVNKDRVDLYLLANSPSPDGEPVSVPDVKNAAAQGNGVDASLVDSADKPTLLALAMDAGLVNESEGATTLTVTPFAWISLVNPEAREDQKAYEGYSWSRRIAGKVTWGGKGDAFDRDGDGDVDDALSTTSASDMVSYELSWRFAGSRDRRESSNYATFYDAVTADINQRRELLDEITDHANDVLGTANSSTSAQDCERAITLLRQNPDASLARKLADVEKRLLSASSDWIRETDESTLWSLVANGTERDEKFGGDQRTFGLRMSKGAADLTAGSGSNQNLQIDYLRLELPNGRDKLEGVKLGYEYSRLYPRFPFSKWKDATLSVSAVVEKYSDAPIGVADSVAKAQAKISFKAGDNIKIPISLTWANRASLLDDNDDVVAHVGISYDFDAFFSRK